LFFFSCQQHNQHIIFFPHKLQLEVTSSLEKLKYISWECWGGRWLLAIRWKIRVINDHWRSCINHLWNLSFSPRVGIALGWFIVALLVRVSTDHRTRTTISAFASNTAD
jgi:hypothetical protein